MTTTLFILDILMRFLLLILFLLQSDEVQTNMCRSRGGDRGSGPPLENYKNIGFLSNIGPDPLKITKLPIQHSMLGHHRPARDTPFKCVNSGISHQTKKKVVKVGPTLTKLSGSAYDKGSDGLTNNVNPDQTAV